MYTEQAIATFIIYVSSSLICTLYLAMIVQSLFFVQYQNGRPSYISNIHYNLLHHLKRSQRILCACAPVIGYAIACEV